MLPEFYNWFLYSSAKGSALRERDSFETYKLKFQAKILKHKDTKLLALFLRGLIPGSLGLLFVKTSYFAGITKRLLEIQGKQYCQIGEAIVRMKQSQFDVVLPRQRTCSVKWDNLDATFGTADVLPMWVADMDFAAPPAVVEAIRERAAHGVYGYPIRTAEFYQAIGNWMQRRHHWAVQPEWILNIPGVVPGISAVIQAFTQPGDKIIIQPPVYPPFFSCVTQSGRQVVENTLLQEGDRYVIDFDQLTQLAQAGAKLLLLCNPHNPVGRSWTPEELRKLSQICLEYQIILISDEIHGDLIFKGHRHTPVASLSPEVSRNTVTLTAPSKTFNIAGLNTAVAIVADENLRKKLQHMLEMLHISGGNLFGILALDAAYRHGEDWLVELLLYLESNADYLVGFLAERVPQIQVRKPECTYLAWLDCRQLGMNVVELKRFFTLEAKVGLNAGYAFGTAGEGFMRLNFGCSRAMLQQGLEQIGQAVNAKCR